jgi:RNA polymerase sigma-70 factor, ECF subfamily
MAKVLAGASRVGYLAGAVAVSQDEASIVAELRAGSESAYEWLIAHYHQPVYSLVYRILNDPADAADTTQEVFLKVYRGIKGFNGNASLKTWIYRIAVHEASNQRRWWFRHKRKEDSMETPIASDEGNEITLEATLVDAGESPFEQFEHEEVRVRVEAELQQVPEPYRTTVVLRDIEGLAYEEIAAVLDVSLGTVKSRLMRGREALRKRLLPYVQEVGEQMGLKPAAAPRKSKMTHAMEAETKR